MNALTPLKTLAAVAIAAAVSAQAAQGDDLMNEAVARFKASGDAQMRTIVAAFIREALDRGGWSNPFVRGDHYAMGEPLLAAAIGSGVTSRGSASEASRLLAAR